MTKITAMRPATVENAMYFPTAFMRCVFVLLYTRLTGDKQSAYELVFKITEKMREILNSPMKIHGHELRSFVEDETSQDRYQDVARWLQLGRLVEVQMDLRELRRRTKAAAEDQTAIRFFDTQLTTRSAGVVNAWDEAAVLEYANTLLVVLDKTFSLKSLDRADPVFMTTQSRAETEEKQLGLEHRQ
ncbi:hypothetical protein IID24_05700, partial [Patescibacteria group bacterium]|nr:hypothetical protein [Patescibacteria group bacterium]